MKKLLITGFDPFGGESVNPSWEAVRRLAAQIGKYELTKLQIPTVFGEAFQKVQAAMQELQPDAVLCIGQAGGRSSITPEVVAINLREAAIADNAGNQPINRPVVEGGRLPISQRSRSGRLPARCVARESPVRCRTRQALLCATMCCIPCCMRAAGPKPLQALSMCRFCPNRQKKSPPVCRRKRL